MSAEKGIGALSIVCAFNHNWVPMSCLQPLNNTNKGWTNNNIQWIHQQLWSQFLVPHNTLNSTMSPWAWCSSRCSYTALAVSVYTKLPCCSLQWSITQSFLLQICIAREAVFLKLHEYASLARWSSPIAGWVAHLGKLWWNWSQSGGQALCVRLLSLQHQYT